VTRRIVITLVLVVVLVVGVALGADAIRRLDAKDSSSQQQTLRTRIDLIEADPFVNALLASAHSTRTVQELLDCQPQQASRWNFRAVISGHLDIDRVETLLAQPQAFGWTDAGPDIFAKAIESGVVVKLVAVLGRDALTMTANVSTGLACVPA
jgi:hypothetical protein